ncbi:hypothetical protein GCM10009570_05040 [Dietzia natronolimnaea]
MRANTLVDISHLLSFTYWPVASGSNGFVNNVTVSRFAPKVQFNREPDRCLIFYAARHWEVAARFGRCARTVGGLRRIATAATTTATTTRDDEASSPSAAPDSGDSPTWRASRRSQSRNPGERSANRGVAGEGGVAGKG